MNRTPLAALALTTLLAGCGEGLGDFCTSDRECQDHLRCSAAPDERGVCTLPEGVVVDEPASVGDDAGTDGGAESDAETTSQDASS
jgi:hypothetical protein